MFRSRIDYQAEIPRVQGRNTGVPAPWRAAIFLVAGIGTIETGRTYAGGGTPTASQAAPSEKPASPEPRIESRLALKPALATKPAATTSSASVEPIKSAADESIDRALRLISECKARYRGVTDYSCDFYKRERINGRLTDLHVMNMKERTQPKSIYFKFQQPNRGREAIYVRGRNNGYVLAHDVGFTKFLAGTMELDPKGSMAMENNRHPITEAGIGELIDTVESRWSKELDPRHSVINHFEDLQVGPHSSIVMVESIHPERQPEFLFHKVRLYVNREHGLPIRFEAYDWPRTPTEKADLIEEYTYLNLKINVGLKESDFDPANSLYSFGRF